ncbi:MAG: hypothetical protein R3Y53_07825 [Bacillota bacterium]
MKQPHKNLNALLEENHEAREFFSSLTKKRQAHVSEYNDFIHSKKELLLYSELLWKGGQ